MRSRQVIRIPLLSENTSNRTKESAGKINDNKTIVIVLDFFHRFEKSTQVLMSTKQTAVVHIGKLKKDV